MIRSILASALAIGMAGGASATTVTSEYSSFWVIGDSLSDNGNLFAVTGGTRPASPPYANGRFSNGDVWNEGILEEFANQGKASGNFAFGGARTIGGDAPSLEAQTDLFEANAAPFAGSNPLVSIWMGANDLLNSIGAPDSIEIAINAANNVREAVQEIAETGVDDFVIFNLPSLGATPAFATFQPAASGLADAATDAFNLQLADNIAQLEADGLNVIDIDIAGFLDGILADPSTFGFDETSIPCILPSAEAAAALGQAQVCDAATAEGRLFFDSIHPNATAHAIVEDLVRNRISAELIAPVPLPASAPLILFALGCLGFAARRKAS